MANNPYVNKVQFGNQTLIDLSSDTVTADKLMQGYTAHDRTGALITGTATGGGYVTQDQDGYIVLPSTGGGGSPSATQHVIRFEFSDSTTANINAWYDDSFISNAITATTPTTYGQKTVTLAQLDGVTWYESAPIPLNTELIDFTKVSADTIINSSGGTESEQWYYASDYTAVEQGMTFSYTGATWYYIGVYDASKTVLRTIYIHDDGTPDPEWNSRSFGTLSGNELTNAAYVRITGVGNTSNNLSLIRTA